MRTVEEGIAEIIVEVTEIDRARMPFEGTFREAGIDSLDRLEIIVRIEQIYRIRFLDDELGTMKTFDDLVTLSESKLVGRNG
jgi:acyl carrier protein